MSVLKSKRRTSKAEFVNTANSIFLETVNFLTRLSARYSRIIAEPTAKIARDVRDRARRANEIFPSDPQKATLRRGHLIEAQAALGSLDEALSDVYQILILNPEGCFTTSTGKTVDASTASKKLDKMAQHLGDLIDRERELLAGALRETETHL